MRILRFSDGRHEGVGVVVGDVVHDVSPFATLRGLAAVVATGRAGHAVVADWTARSTAHALADVTVLPPVDDRSRIFCAALNYADHAAEAARPLPTEPLLFLKLPSNLVGATETIDPPPVGTFLDYEGELAIVVGRGGGEIGEDAALDHVLGLTVMNDVTARDLQRRERDGQTTIDWFSAKALDRSTPLGPAIVTLDEAPAVADIRIRTTVNDATVQDGRTADMLFPVERLVAYVSARVALQPLDVIATGTPHRTEAYRGRRLTSGDVVEVAVDGVGRLRNPVG